MFAPIGDEVICDAVCRKYERNTYQSTCVSCMAGVALMTITDVMIKPIRHLRMIHILRLCDAIVNSTRPELLACVLRQ